MGNISFGTGFEPGRKTFEEVAAGVGDYAILLLDEAGRVVTWNRGAEAICGYSESEMLGRNLSVLYPNDADRSNWPDHQLAAAASTGRFEEQSWMLRRDGTRFWADTVITALRGPGGEVQGYLDICRDLTARKQAEEKLRVSEERFRLMVDGVKDYAIFMLDPAGRITTWNSGAERLKGYQAGEVIGRHFSLFYPQQAIDRGWPEEELRRAKKQGRLEDEGWRLRKDGSRFWANVVITALFDELNNLIGFAKVTRDLTERRDAERQARQVAEEAAARRAAEEASAERERLVDELRLAHQRKDQFLATLAHELRNPLAPLRSAVEILKHSGSDQRLLEETRLMMERQLLHLVRLVDDLMDLSRISRGKVTLQKQPLTVQAVMEHALEISGPVLRSFGHQVQVNLSEESFWLEGDLTRLSQVLANLLNNSAKFTPPGGEICLSAGRRNGQIEIVVSDNGIGIPPGNLSEVFEMFTQVSLFQEHSQAGLGIGLSLVKYLVELHGGHVEVSSQGKNQGSEFRVYLPETPTVAPGESRQSTDASRSGGCLRVLVVDDNRDAAKMLATLLKLFKQEVAQAHDGVQALEVGELFRPDLVLMDIGMPRMNGHETCRAMRQLDWGRQAVIAALTGWGQDEDKAHCRESGFDHHFVKPLESGALERLVQEVLQRKPRP